MSRRHQIVCTVLIIIFAAMVIFFAAYREYLNVENRLYNEKVQEVAAPYKAEHIKYTTEMKNLDRELYAMLPCGATMTIVVTSTNEMLYTDVYPIFNGTSKYNVKNETLKLTGTICLSDTDLPGGEGNVTLEQFNEMIEAGWTTALYFDYAAAGNVEAYLLKMSGLLSSLGIEMPDSAYFLAGAYNTDYDGMLISRGIKNVIHHEERGLDLIGTDLDSTMWRVGDIGWNNTTLANPTFTALMSTAGGLSFSVGFNDWDRTRYFSGDDVGSAAFARMLDKFRECVRDESMFVDSLKEGKVSYMVHNTEYLRLSPMLDERRQELQVKIDELNAILFKIYSGDFSVAEKED